MALVICKICRRAFISSPQEEDICSECMVKLKEVYPVVRNFLRDNEKTPLTAYDVSRMLNIELKDIDGLIALGLIRLADSETAAATPPPGKAPGRDGFSMHKYRKKKQQTRKRDR